MAARLNAFSDSWLPIFSTALFQNSIFLLIIFILLYVFRKQDPRLLKGLAWIGLLKLVIPPVLPVSGFSGFINGQILYLPEITIRPGMRTGAESGLNNSSLLFILWFVPALFFLLNIYGNIIVLQ